MVSRLAVRFRLWQTSAEPELSPLLRSAAWGSMAVAIAGLAWSQGVPLHGAIALAVMTGGHVYSHRNASKPTPNTHSLLLAALIGLSLALMWVGLFVGFSGGLPPQAQSSVAILCIASFDLKTRRNLFIMLIYSLLLLYIAADTTFSPWLLLFLVTYGLATLAALFAASVADGQRVALRVIVRRPSLGTALSLLGLLILLSFGTIALFVLLPRPANSQLLGSPLVSYPLRREIRGQTVTPLFPFVSLAPNSTGVKEPQMSLAYRGKPGQNTVLYVRSEIQSYWRGLALDEYDGQSWRSTSGRRLLVRQRQGWFDLEVPISANSGTEYAQSFTVVQEGAEVLLTGYWPKTVHHLSPTVILEGGLGGSLIDARSLSAGTSYAVLSRFPTADLQSLRRDHAIHPENRYTQLPTLSPAVRQVAESVTAGAATDIDRVQALVRFLQANFTYDLNIPPLPLNRDATEVFLFDDKRGFCQQFATTLAVLARSIGIPARIVTGYLPGQYQPLLGAFEVVASDAHSWVEIHFEAHGWVPFDSTPSVGGDPRAQWRTSLLSFNWGTDYVLTLGITFQHAIGLVTTQFESMSAGFAAWTLMALLGALVCVKLVWQLGTWSRRKRLPLNSIRPGHTHYFASYKLLEQTLMHGGSPARQLWETPKEHLARSAIIFPKIEHELAEIATTISTIAYASKEPERALLTMATARIADVIAIIRLNRTPQVFPHLGR